MRQADKGSPGWHLPALVVLAAFSVGGALLVSKGTYGLGFPLDDAWIHQTYARNLAERGEWAFVPGQPSAGSTAPLWTGVLAVGYWLGADPRLWSYLLGGLLLVGTAWFSSRWLAIRVPEASRWQPYLAALILVEWHLVWSSVSGMEILALTFLIVMVLLYLDTERWNAVGIGALIGLGVWIRPDAITLLLPAGIHIIFQQRTRFRHVLARMGIVSLGFLLLMVPYLAFNWNLSGVLWPSTFYAKQAEYAVMREAPILSRLLGQLSLPLVGIGAVLFPGIILGVVAIIRKRRWRRLAALIWGMAFLGMYAWRLPVTYQHGRYAMPTIPMVLVLGVEGLSRWVTPDAQSVLRRVISRTWLASLGAVAIIFWFRGARTYARDVAIIETEMVATAQWISDNTRANELVAVHDIGAMGYFSDRPMLDLAGLVSPEVIPILRDEAALAKYLDSREAKYLVTFPGWYPELVAEAEFVHTTTALFSPQAGGENMTVYRWVPQAFAP